MTEGTKKMLTKVLIVAAIVIVTLKFRNQLVSALQGVPLIGGLVA